MDFKALEFAQKESKGSWWNPTKWLGQYLYTDIHEISFSEFPIVLHEWLSNLETQQRNFQGGEPMEWNPQLIQQLKSMRNPMSRAIEFSVDSILQGYITKFVVDIITSFSEGER